MISAARASRISLERDTEKREKLIDGLKEQEAKYMLKMILRVINQQKQEGNQKQEE